ncbi:MAG: hypothetical protein E6I64_01230 [Chloroflexi bacterium]|nr:MAG: hypothetical protein E6I64_01230 [Chloroflexota bacterium]
MTGQFFFTTIAALGLSTAGFASLVTALRREGRWSRISLWRLRAIVGESLTITIVAILPLPIYYAVGGDEALVIRIISGVLALKFAFSIVRTIPERREWGTRYVAQAVALIAIQLVAQVANLRLASLALLMFGLLLWLAYPVQLLFAVIRDFQPPVD